MVGRFALTASPDDVARRFTLATIDPFPPRPLILPTQPVMVVLAGSEGRTEAFLPGRAALLVRWGLIPGWFRGEEQLPALFNARAETVHDNAAFRGALRHRRCLVPASAVLRRLDPAPRDAATPKRREAGGVRRLTMADAPVFAMAGLMETYLAPDGSEIDTAAILTAPAQAPDRAVIDRLPVVIASEDYGRWLDCRNCGPGDIADLLAAPPLAAFTLSDRD